MATKQGETIRKRRPEEATQKGNESLSQSNVIRLQV
jgi:hypothetical protein